MERPADHPAIPSPKVGVLLINLGTPDAPNTAAVRRYLGQFLTDPRVIEIPALLWRPILHGIVLRTLAPYYDDPLYIDALVADLERQLGVLDFAPDALLLSFHGMPERTLRLGDPYHCHCRKTARLVAERLSLPVETSFQSRFGRA